ncbi:cutinase family protein [Antrihabitans sp. YC2-6]|nr:cutinase family protein [Antrihabitans sp. YC2-6]
MGRTSRRPARRRVLPLLAAVVAAVLVLIVAVLAWMIFKGRPGPGPGPGPGGPETRPDTQSASCPDVQVVAVPGTWESSSGDDPYNPQPPTGDSLLLHVTGPLAAQFPAERADIYTVPYLAQFARFPPNGERSYDESRADGTARTTKILADRHAECPLTTYIIAGFSQGAVIAGDVAAQIAAGNGPVPEDEVLGVMLIADGRRASEQSVPIGPNPGGVGAEVALSGLRVPGISMTGVRGGFGPLADRTFSICSPGDMICDAPRDAMKPVNMIGSAMTLVASIGNPVHMLYNDFIVEPGVTATQWTANWAAGLVNGAPHPAHPPS